ncbi:MAG: prenyltransferase, partial [Ruminococcus sp.]|nr:prenyltransferase [Ruminococcus sp.]
NFLLVYRLSWLSVLALFINVSWMTWKFIEYMRDPHKFRLVEKVERYTYIQETIMLLTVGGYIAFAR